MVNFGKLMRLAKGALSPEEFQELCAGMGMNVTFETVPEDRKADAFQRLAQFSLLPGAEVSMMTVSTMQGRFEGLLVLRPSQKGNVTAGEKTVDAGNGIPLSLPQSA